MTDAAIFLFHDGVLTPLVETPYENEPLLQKALAEYPELLAGSATTGMAARLLLVRREMPVAGPSGASSMSLDHLFVDSTGVPVLVEVKRSSDTRARREVVAQLLDYAANGVAYWPPGQLREFVEQAATDPTTVLVEMLGVEEDPDTFWRTVDDNLRAGRIRLIFLADRLPEGLVRIIEFLNEQMRDTEVLGIELPQYRGPGEAIVYVPRLVGRTAVAVDTKQGTQSLPRWTREAMLTAAEDVCTPTELTFVQMLLGHVDAHGGRFSWGTGSTAGFTGWYIVDGQDTPVWNINLGSAPGHGKLYFILREFASRHELSPRMESYASAVAAIGTLASRVASSRSDNWRGWVGLPLSEASAASEQAVNAVDAAIGTS